MGLLERLFPPLSKDRFARRAVRLLARNGQPKWTYYPDTFSLRDTGDGILNLHNIYATYRQVPMAGRKGAWQTILSLASNLNVEQKDWPWSEVKSRILLRVRERFYYHAVGLQLAIQAKPGSKPFDFAYQPINDELDLELVLDSEQHVSTISRKMLAEWGVTFEEALAVAKDNLWQISNAEFRQIAPGVYMSPFNDTYDAARLYLSDLVWRLPVKGAVVAAVPNRNLFLLTGSDDAAGLAMLCKLTTEALRSERPMTGKLFQLTGNQWTVFQPPADHPSADEIKTLYRLSRLSDYTEQTELLTTWCKHVGRDCFVAKVLSLTSGSGRMFSMATWADVTDELLPEAEFVIFANQGGSQVADWADVRRVMGDEMKATDHWPPRFEISRFPTTQELEAMNAISADQFKAKRGD